ncbi:MAG: HAMP domain-containing protein [Betaproteobacteria bacterium]|nr:HAMP domain-containing protein [Betaproteobacteria bacterium]
MRLAVKFFLAFSLVILVLAGIAAWSLYEVGKLTIADRTITVRAAEALRSAAYLREAVSTAKRVDMRSLVFGDKEYTDASSTGATNITQEIDRLAGLLTTEQEQTLIRAVATGFKDYYATVTETRELRKRGGLKRAEKLMQDEAQPGVDRVVENLDRLVKITRDNLDQTQTEATAALGQARREIEALRTRTWEAVITAMLLAVVVALAGTGIISFRMTRSLGRLSDATKAVAEGSFREPLPIDTKDEIGALAKSFNTMAARLRETDEMKEKFYATVSHELRSPLNAMSEAARLIEAKTAGPLTEKQKRLIAIFQKGTERLLRLVNEVLDLSRVNTGMLPVERRWFVLETAVRQAIEELRPQAEQRGITLRMEAASGSERMLGDEDRIVQVVVNLVGNSLRFTPTGGSVTVRLHHTASEMQIQVEDTGIGIPTAFLPVVFDRFRQAHSGKGGTGLGLAIVKSLVEAHDGKVTVESQEGKGSRFTVSLPRGRASDATMDREVQEA